MNTDKMMLLVESFGDTWSPECECTVDEFVRDNEEALDETDRADLAHLEVGQRLYYGGGAGVRFRVTRTS